MQQAKEPRLAEIDEMREPEEAWRREAAEDGRGRDGCSHGEWRQKQRQGLGGVIGAERPQPVEWGLGSCRFIEAKPETQCLEIRVEDRFWDLLMLLTFVRVPECPDPALLRYRT